MSVYKNIIINKGKDYTFSSLCSLINHSIHHQQQQKKIDIFVSLINSFREIRGSFTFYFDP